MTDPLDIAFIALGAAEVWRSEEAPYQKFDGGYLEFISEAIGHAPMCSAAFRALPDGEFTGTWAYSVALPFGRWLGRELLEGNVVYGGTSQIPEHMLTKLVETAK